MEPSEWLKLIREHQALERLNNPAAAAAWERQFPPTLGPHTNPLRATQGFTEADKARAVDEAQRIVMEGLTHG